MKTEKSCGIIPLIGTRYLLICHKNGLHWDFPKGHVEEGENEEQTAARELMEETGLVADMVPFFREELKYSPAPGVMKTVVFFIGKASGKVKIQEEEVKSYKILSYDKAREKLTYPSSKQLLDKAHTFIASDGLN